MRLKTPPKDAMEQKAKTSLYLLVMSRTQQIQHQNE